MNKLQFKPHFQVEVVRPNTVYLLSEESAIALTGDLYCQLAPFLHGSHTVEEIITQLPEVDSDNIYYAIDKLKAKYLIEGGDRHPRQMSAFWSSLNLDPETSWQRLQQTTVSITSYGDVPTDFLITTLKSLGVKVHPTTSNLKQTSLAVILTDDYLRADLAEFNQKAIAAGIPWMLVKPIGIKLWLGPIFAPDQTGCWQCLAQRLSHNQEVISTIQQQNQKFIPTSLAFLPSTLQTGIDLAATEIVKWIVRGKDKSNCSTTLAGKVITLDSTNLDLQTHLLTKRPQCPACGDQLDRDRQPQKIILTSQKKQFTIDGGHRILSPKQTLARWQHHISPITGVVSALVRTSEPGSNHSYLAVHNFGKATDLKSLRQNLHNKAAGKGRTESQAKASGFCEAVERYSGLFQGDEIRVSNTYTQLKSAIHPVSCLQFSQNQYQNRKTLNQTYSGVDFIPQPFTEEQKIEWTPVWSLTEKTFKYMSTALCYYKYPLTSEHFGVANSNGNAAGNAIEEAIVQGFLELVERDAVAIWWYNRLQCRTVDLESFQDSYIAELQTYYQNRGREFWVLDITSDLGIPVLAAVSRCIKGKEILVAGYGAHLDPKIALMRALTEMNQFLSRVEVQYPHGLEAGLRQWLTSAKIAEHSYLAPNTQMTSKVYQDYAQCWSDDLRQDVVHCVAIAAQHDLETLVLDQTRTDIGLNVVKVIVPGLRHFLPRFAPGRLYDVPVKMGRLSKPLLEKQMNPVPMPF